MQRTTMIQQEWWDLRAEATWGNTPAGQDVVALRAENDQLRRALAGRAVIDQARGMVMVLTPCRRGAARKLLVDVSRKCDARLPEVAAALVAAWEGASRSRHTCSGRYVVRCGDFTRKTRGAAHDNQADRPGREGP
ncbi:ANTAR domain-containing protein [Streptomyces bottropensis]|uniref:ANTAR domain-containing protein n=1 Tax=Streptomyces bottropensis TaxID=42235 RepID=UPI0036A9B797